MMRVWFSNDHKGHWPVGGASIVVAEEHGMAFVMLIEALRRQGIHDTAFTLTEVDQTRRHVLVLCDGEY
jgi:CubicO group peptidase (beta-lactamase class C family)